MSSFRTKGKHAHGDRRRQRPPNPPLDPHQYYGYYENPGTSQNTGQEGAENAASETLEYIQEAPRSSEGHTSAAWPPWAGDSGGYNPEAVTYSQQGTQVSGNYPAVYSTQPYTVESLSQKFAGVQISPATGSSHVNRNVLAAGESYTGWDPPGYVRIAKPNKFFTVGRVFRVLWTEPFAGSESEHDIEDELSYLSDTKFGGKAFSKVRRFVVVKEQKGACLCIPLNTYNGQGVTKRGINPRDHAAVYPSPGKPGPKLLPGERGTIVKDPFPIIVEDPKEKIDPMSRINFSRVYTVEHNMKVLKVGRIPPSYHKLLKRYFFESIAGPQEGSEHEMVKMPSSPGQVPDHLSKQRIPFATTMPPNTGYQPYVNLQSSSKSSQHCTVSYANENPEENAQNYADPAHPDNQPYGDLQYQTMSSGNPDYDANENPEENAQNYADPAHPDNQPYGDLQYQIMSSGNPDYDANENPEENAQNYADPAHPDNQPYGDLQYQTMSSGNPAYYATNQYSSYGLQPPATAYNQASYPTQGYSQDYSQYNSESYPGSPILEAADRTRDDHRYSTAQESNKKKSSRHKKR